MQSNDARALQVLQRIETPTAAITLTRTSTLAITTAGTTITWQSQTRGQGITWSGTDITIPTAGYYAINFTYQGSATHTAYAVLSVSGTVTGLHTSSYATQVAATAVQSFAQMRYFSTGAVVQVRVFPSVNVTVNVNAESTSNESPILHIVQLTAAVS